MTDEEFDDDELEMMLNIIMLSHYAGMHKLAILI